MAMKLIRRLFGTLIAEFQKQWQIDALFVADAALYTEKNWQMMVSLKWVSRVPATLTAAKELLENISSDAFIPTRIPGDRIAPCYNNYAGDRQRWLVVESEARKESDFKQLEKPLAPTENCVNKNLHVPKMFSLQPNYLRVSCDLINLQI